MRIMVQGTASSVGKSLITAALCRIFKQDGYSVAPFKSQNMALNSFITQDGAEIGRAQAVQAQAAGIQPSALMNPILLKPSSDQKSQVILNGKAIGNMSAKEYHAYKPQLREMVKSAFNELKAQYDVVVLEGAGSPAEINLRENDIVNMGMAELANAPVLLAGDIDRGGVFASIVGTLQLLRPHERGRVKCVIINKFRGDIDILKPGIKMLEDITDLPVAGVIPHARLDIEEEDSLTERFTRHSPGAGLSIGVIRLPYISNFTDFMPLEIQPDIALRYINHPAELADYSMIILPGSKNVIDDLAFLRKSGLATRLINYARRGGVLAGICGGYQMLGGPISDDGRIESDTPTTQGMGLLDVATKFSPDKITRQSQCRILSHSGDLWQNLGGLNVNGYEIHMGDSICGGKAAPLFALSDGQIAGAANISGNVWGTYLHGIFDNFEFLKGLLDRLRELKGIAHANGDIAFERHRENEYNRLADLVRNSVDMDLIYKIARKEG